MESLCWMLNECMKESSEMECLKKHYERGQRIWLLLLLPLLITSQVNASSARTPLVVSTWPFVEAVRVAWNAVEQGMPAVDAVVEGCSTCETLQCDGSVGYGGSPDEKGESTLDAMVMDGTTMNVGAVGALRFVKEAIRTAKLVLEHTEHTLLVGDQASNFAVSLGIPGPTNLSTDESYKKWLTWKKGACQPNFWVNVTPNSKSSCGPYHLPADRDEQSRPELQDVCLTAEHLCLNSKLKRFNRREHDTISMIVIDKGGRIAAGTSSNGAHYKIPGRVGDAPIVGASAYANWEVGACGATGDGDVMMRFLPCYQVVESMRLGHSPTQAAEDAILRIKRKYPSFTGALIAVNMDGVHGAACHGWTFQYSVQNYDKKDVDIFTVHPVVETSTLDM